MRTKQKKIKIRCKINWNSIERRIISESVSNVLKVTVSILIIRTPSIFLQYLSSNLKTILLPVDVFKRLLGD